ncbi:MAG: serine/threonine protein kinase [Chloroflexota bacterium]|nr:MAG: serine/threonine protein kinase [Chloroflexota bacterium]
MAATGDVLAGRYRIEGPLGAGGMATVLLAHDTLLGRRVAIKILAPNVAANPALLERFGREARAMATITHPNLVAIYDVGWVDADAGQEPFLVMELVAGGTLADRLAAEGPLALPVVVELVEGLASALDTLHRAGVVHRDVKPQNVLLAPSGPKLADLGVIRVDDPSDPAADLTASGATPGTLRFLAPEVIFGQPAGPKADAYALAMVAYEAITGRSPRPAMTLGELVHGAWQPITPVSEARPELGSAFDAAFAAALDLDPNRRLEPMAFAAELWHAVSAWAAAPAAADGAKPAVAPDPSERGEDAASADGADAVDVGGGIDVDGATVVGAGIDVDGRTDIAEAGLPGSAGIDAATVEANPLADTVEVPGTEIAVISGVARPNPTAFRPGDDTTAEGRPIVARPSEVSASQSTDEITRVGAGLARVAVVIGIVVVVLLAVRGFAGGTLAPDASASAAAESGPVPSAAATPSPPVPGPAAAALQALDDVKAAIERARGGRDGLKGNDANDLVALADDVGQALEAADYAAARSATEELAERVGKVADELDEARREALQGAVEALQAAIPPA